MLKRLAVLLAAFMFLICMAACSENEGTSDKDKLSVYYVNSNAYEDNGNYIEKVDYYLADNEDMVNNSLAYLGVAPEGSGLISSLVKGTRIYSYEINDGVIDIALSPAYNMLNELEKATLKCCITLTLCGISEIQYINIYVDGKLVDEMLDAGMMIIEDTETNQFEKRINLYFPDANNYYLHTESRVLTVGQDVPLVEYVIEELIKSTQTEELTPSIPQGTQLISADVKNGVCTVDLSEEFITNRPETAAGQRLMVYSMVNSIAELENVEYVQFTVEGKSANGYEYIDVSDSFTAFNDIVYHPHEVSNQFAAIYLGMRGTDNMMKIPVIIDREQDITTEESIVKYILDLPDIGGYENTVPSTMQLVDVETVNGSCTVNLAMPVLSDKNLKDEMLASNAIAASIIDSGAVQQVTVIIDGERYIENATELSDLIINN